MGDQWKVVEMLELPVRLSDKRSHGAIFVFVLHCAQRTWEKLY